MKLETAGAALTSFKPAFRSIARDSSSAAIEVAAAIQKAVYRQVVDFTGMNVKSIDVVITDTEDSPDGSDYAEEAVLEEKSDVVDAELVD